MRSLNVQTQQLQVELQDLERKKKFKAAEVTTTKEHIEAAKVGQTNPGWRVSASEHSGRHQSATFSACSFLFGRTLYPRGLFITPDVDKGLANHARQAVRHSDAVLPAAACGAEPCSVT